MSQKEVLKTVQKFLTEGNRPYAINDVLSKCGQELGKSAVQKALDTLVESNQLTVKLFGKVKIYFPKQTTDLVKLEQELKSTAQQLAQAQAKQKQKTEEYRQLTIKLRAIKETRTLESLDDERNELFNQIRALNEKLSQQEKLSKETQLTPADVQRIEKRHDKLSTNYRKRKRICGDMLDAILEGYPKSKKALIEDIGLETDEAAGFALQQNVKR